MPIVIAIVALAALLWGAIYARRGSLVVGCGVLIVLGYVLGHEFWNTHVGPLPITLDRLLLIAILAACLVQWRLGRFKLRPLTASDYALAAILLTVTASAILSGQPDVSDGVTSKWGRLVTSFFIPAMLYVIASHLNVNRREWLLLLAGFVLLGAYLAFTALCEITGRWAFVFPAYISDPYRGIHFGRARGPELNAVSLGMCLTACFWCTYTLLWHGPRRWLQLALLAVMPLMAIGIYYSYTRSTWLGLAATTALIAAVEIPRRWRVPAVVLSAFAGLLILATSWSHLMGLEREGTAREAAHSVDQRKSFAYVSWQMFRDYPVFGVGFGRFYDRKLPYLSDRSQDFELESIRSLHHHNTFFSVLTETGMVGLMAYLALVVVWTWSAWRLICGRKLPRWSQAHGILMLALIMNYLCSALFHDLTLLPSQHVLLFAFAGLTTAMRQQSFALHQAIRPIDLLRRPIAAISTGGRLIQTSHVQLFGINIDRITLAEAAARILNWCRTNGEQCRYVVTPNVDHAVLYQNRADLRDAYAGASLIVADGAPIVLASRLLGRPLPERVAGSDLVPAIFGASNESLRVFLLGAAAGVAARAAVLIENQWRHVKVVGAYSPPLGFETDAGENTRILNEIAAVRPDLLIVGLGAPKQELWIHAHHRELPAKVVVCAGATIDFLAGHRRRSPVWMRRAGLEWLHRVGSEPRRLAARYARDACVFPKLLWKELRAN
jgi:N-acetylglucosaminyldiphosphoundecaprenol N-acetyl-beta-D-mannosaminyltransferase